MLRSLIGIRKPRQILPPSEMPPVGSNIVMNNLRMRLKYPINHELWTWLSNAGWRTVDMRKDRRHYTMVSDKILIRLINANEPKRAAIHKHLMNASEQRAQRLRHNR
ncbi:hypothetical protein BH11PSE11_BH11PSE11_17720 [soil metagenome]